MKRRSWLIPSTSWDTDIVVSPFERIVVGVVGVGLGSVGDDEEPSPPHAANAATNKKTKHMGDVNKTERDGE